jgi:hypothetical protein
MAPRAAVRRTIGNRSELRLVNPDDQSLYADMRAAIRGDRERAERRTQKTRSDPLSPSRPDTSRPRYFAGVRRIFGGRRKSDG